MKKIALVILMLCSSGIMAQQRNDNVNTKLAALCNEKDRTVLQKKIKDLENGSAEDLNLLIQFYSKDVAKKNTVTKILLKKYPNMHVAVIKADECGGPVFDVDGTFYGINIARHSRTSNIVMPAQVIVDVMMKFL